MTKKIYIFAAVLVAVVLAAFVYVKFLKKTEVPVVASPLSASYTIDGQVYKLVGGKAEVEAAPDSTRSIKSGQVGSPQAGGASKNIVTVFGEPVYGDLDKDGAQDAGVLLSLTTGGSGTFYYMAAAMLKNNTYLGTNAILLGDRIAPQNIVVENGKLLANYAGRGSKDPMTVIPYIGVTKRAYIEGGELKELAILKGRIVWGGEVRTFQPCGEDQGSVESMWIDGKSPALSNIKNSYEREMAGSGPYSPIYGEIIGKEVAVPQDGFGADYKKAILIDELVVASATGSCKQDLIILENIKPGTFIDTKKTLELTGRARGNWYFEASFPIQVLDRHANVLASGYATAQGEWMTTEFVPFKSTLKFTQVPTSGSFGKIVLNKDNPSDMRELDDTLEVFVYFK